ncbi:MAG: ATP-binding cassette domain-containing protein [Holosporaceae bacterium]|jgi:ATPase subunit of ABC transporter with duplicated ATPase domains|nr:ATP-binding cassette domain-containing protein [Holosporaceae bacterium]
MHNPIQIKDFSLPFPHKICFENFSTKISFGDRVGIIGRNGSGKSSLLKMIFEQNPGIAIAHVPQIVEDFVSLSGGERFNRALSRALSKNPSMLLLDEPTNHLDHHNRQSLMRMLEGYFGTLIVATHDRELLRRCTDILWHIDDGKIRIFRGKYDDYVEEMHRSRQLITRQLELLEREKKSLHQNLIWEQERVAKSKSSGKKKVADKKWMKSVGDLKAMKAEKSQGNKLKAVDEKKQKLSERLSGIRLPEIIVPKFHLSHQDVGDKAIVSIVDGSVRYGDKIVLQNINLSINSLERLAIVGDNGCGKTTLIRAICGDECVVKSGDWDAPNPRDIGYLDQHYGNLDPEKSAIEIISDTNPTWTHAEIRKHLNDFLFRKNEEANAQSKNLSGGERARLSLAKIAANPPKLLILDEVTNNIDLETRDHLIEILREYPAAMIIISHDENFLERIGTIKLEINNPAASGRGIG